MARGKRDYLSFFDQGGRGRRRRAGSPIFIQHRKSRLRWIIPLLLIVAAGGGAWWWFAGRSDDTATIAADGSGATVLTAAGDGTTIPNVLTPLESATTGPGGGGDLDLSCPEGEAATDWVTFQGRPDRSGCVEAPVIEDPKLLWATEVGIQGWLNNPVIADGVVYVGSAGSIQFETDRRDGIYAIDLMTGERKWFFEASLDVNGVTVGSGVVVATGDEGLVWGIDIETGRALWSTNLATAVFGNPLIMDDKAIVVDGLGNITAFDVLTGERRWLASIEGQSIRGGVASDGEMIFVAGEQREVLALDLDGVAVWRETVRGRGATGEAARIFAAPTVVGDLVIITLVRDDVYAEPALLALDKGTGAVRWRANDAAGIKTDWGNIRSSPAAVGDLLLYGEPYSEELIAVSLASGETVWSAEVGAFCYPHWPSPAIVSGQVILPRHDGGLYAVDLATGTPAWSIYIGDHGARGNFPAAYPEDFCLWQPEIGTSVLASPAVAGNGVIVVGTLEGHLIAVADESW